MKSPSVIVERVEPGSAADRAGLRRGDRLHTYAGQPLTSPALLQAMEDNIPGFEPVMILGERDGQPWEWSLTPEKRDPQVRSEHPDLAVRFELPDDVLGDYERGHEAFYAFDYPTTLQLWKDLAPRVPDVWACAWMYQEFARAARYNSLFQIGMEAATAAHELLRDEADPAAQVCVWTVLSHCCIGLSDLDSATEWTELARQLDEAMGWQRWLAREIGRLALPHQYRGELREAKKYNTHALTICQEFNPDDPFISMILNNLGNIALMQGDLPTARQHFTDGLEIWVRLTPGTTYEGVGYLNLGHIAWTSGDFGTAMDMFARALQINEQIDPGSHETGNSLENLGCVFLVLGNLSVARDHFTRAMTIFESRGSGPVYVALAHENLGEVAYKQGDYETALERHLNALHIREDFAPLSADVAQSLANLGHTSLKRNETVMGAEYFLRALVIYESICPESLNHASCLAGMGWVDLSQHRPSEAVLRFNKAVEIVEAQRTQILAPEARALLMAEHHRKYAGLLEAYLAVGDVASAFHTLERARSRSFIELLTARSLDTADAPAELLTEQQELDRQRAQTYHQLSSLSGADKDAAQVAALHRTLRDLERRQQEITAHIRTASPHYASLQYPQPLTLAETQATLPPGTLLLSYFVDDDQTFLFSVTDTYAEAHTLPVGRLALHEQVREFRQALDRSRLAHDPKQETALGRALYALLVRPAQKQVRRAERLLLCPDGPLHALPYPALVSSTRGKPQFFGAENPLGQILSATTYAQTRAALPEAAARRLLAFGDPVYQASPPQNATPPDGDMRSRARPDPLSQADDLSLLRTRGLSLAPLPHTRQEVEGLTRLFGDDATVLLGAEATKSAVLAESGGADLLHLACHAWFDPQVPLSSGLVLSQSRTDAGGDNGLLQAWEVFQSLRLSADLVVLSACQTGLGKEVRGEGLVGLARAFQYAGARSLVVTLWDVADESTSLFMQAFYAALKDGAAKDDALRRGVLALQADPRWDAPCYWAAFVLIGDRN